MCIVDNANKFEDSIITVEASIEEVYYAICNSCGKEKVLSAVIAWLPNIAKIEIEFSLSNNWLDITFINGEEIRLYNTKIEDTLHSFAQNKY